MGIVSKMMEISTAAALKDPVLIDAAQAFTPRSSVMKLLR
jgi:hypothetical protein